MQQHMGKKPAKTQRAGQGQPGEGLGRAHAKALGLRGTHGQGRAGEGQRGRLEVVVSAGCAGPAWLESSC